MITGSMLHDPEERTPQAGKPYIKVMAKDGGDADPGAMARRAIEKVMAEYPDLSLAGLRASNNEENFALHRQEMTTDKSLFQFARAAEYLLGRKKTVSINRRAGSSYGLKHRAEAWHRERARREGRSYDCYIANGMFIAAAISLGFKIKRCEPRSLNAFFNLGQIPIGQ